MFNIFLIVFAILSTALVLTSGRSPYPIAQDLEKQCLNMLNKTNVVSDCYEQAMAKWPAQANGRDDNKWEERDTCCLQYDQIDCKINAIKSGKCSGDCAKAALNYQNKLINYWNTTHCLTVPYKSGLCTLPPTPSIECIKKCQKPSLACMSKIKKDWNVTDAQMDGFGKNVPAKSFCCGTWEYEDCVMDVFKDHCNSSDIEIAEKDRADQFKKFNSGVCVNFTYHSKACPYKSSSSVAENMKISMLSLVFSTIFYCTLNLSK